MNKIKISRVLHIITAIMILSGATLKLDGNSLAEVLIWTGLTVALIGGIIKRLGIIS